MSYQEFISEVMFELKKRVVPGIKIIEKEILKNNGVIWKGIVFQSNDEAAKVTPTIYLENFYITFKDGHSIDEICEKILEVYNAIPQVSISKNMFDFDNYKERIVYKILNYKANSDLLENIPYIQYLDLAIVFYVIVDKTSQGLLTLTITDEFLGLWEITLNELYSLAKENTPKILPYSFQPTDSSIHEIVQDLEWEDDEELSALIVRSSEVFTLTNACMNFGACCILYDGLLKKIGEKLQKNYFVIPSSIHETLICVEKTDCDARMLKEFIQDINQSYVDPNEFLSDHPYYYDRELDRLELA